ncbi:unnamed protein product [Durusdinium trenchii]|uniref:Uncharacterized protein n=1 Tax=Durusdinium trenchii TaxID=1381693 RepID=A0ABP0S0N1_9DINO
MALRPESVDDWCQLMPNLLEENGWNSAMVTSEAALMNTSCPWGGHLIKFELKEIAIHHAPEETANVMVRPEVRSLQPDQCPIQGISVRSVDFVAPGEAVVEATSSWSIVRLCSVLFGDMAGQVMNYFFRDAEPVAWHQEVRRNYPKAGDSGCAFWKEEDGDDRSQEFMVLVRPDGRGTFTTYVVVRVYEDRFAQWAQEHFSLVLSSARSTAVSYLNRPGIVELRKQDERFYVTISMQSFKRGMPLLPAFPSEAAVTEIDAGEPYGLRRWLRYEPNSQKFHLSSYLQVFLARLGYQVDTYDPWIASNIGHLRESDARTSHISHEQRSRHRAKTADVGGLLIHEEATTHKSVGFLGSNVTTHNP